MGGRSQGGPFPAQAPIAGGLSAVSPAAGRSVYRDCTAPHHTSLRAAPSANAGVGSGVNDTTRELGGTLGVAVVGSVFASLYAAGFDGAPAALPTEAASDSVGAAFQISAQLGGAPGEALRSFAATGFYDGLAAGCLVAAGVCAVGAVMVLALLPQRPADEAAETERAGSLDPGAAV